MAVWEALQAFTFYGGKPPYGYGRDRLYFLNFRDSPPYAGYSPQRGAGVFDGADFPPFISNPETGRTKYGVFLPVIPAEREGYVAGARVLRSVYCDSRNASAGTVFAAAFTVICRIERVGYVARYGAWL